MSKRPPLCPQCAKENIRSQINPGTATCPRCGFVHVVRVESKQKPKQMRLPGF